MARAIDSVLKQTHEDWELIVYNVGDPVDVPQDPRIHYHEGDRQGPAADFQAALNLATGDIITPLADDDRLPPHALETVARHIGEHEWLNAGTVIVGENGYPTAIRGGTYAHLQETLDGSYMLGGAIYWRKTLTDRLGGFSSEFDGAADFDLYLRFAKDQEPKLVKDILYLYNDHAGTDSRVNRERQGDAHQRVAASR